MIIKALTNELRAIEGCIEHMEITDTAWCREYTVLRKKKRIVKNAIKKLQKLEENR